MTYSESTGVAVVSSHLLWMGNRLGGRLGGGGSGVTGAGTLVGGGAGIIIWKHQVFHAVCRARPL